MKNVLIAFDKFKDALPALEACEIAASALAAAQPGWTVAISPLADGGDGFCDTLTRVAQGRFHHAKVLGPLGQPIQAQFGMVDTKSIAPEAAQLLGLPESCSTLAIVEFAQSSGIALVPEEARTPWTTTSFGLGETLAKAREAGADAALVGLGGSATHDLALGALRALGYQFLDREGRLVEAFPSPQRWPEIKSIRPPAEPFGIPLRIACDVENPLCGPRGAAAVFGPQKGLAKSDFETLDSETARLAILLAYATGTGIQLMNTPGAGAAGGSAFGLMAGLDGRLVAGAELVFRWTELHRKLQAADLVITGEGRFDASSLQGKGPGSLARQALAAGKELLVLAGSVGELPDSEIAGRARAITPPGTPLPEALAATPHHLAAAIRAAF